jgi:hypothetical protein
MESCPLTCFFYFQSRACCRVYLGNGACQVSSSRAMGMSEFKETQEGTFKWLVQDMQYLVSVVSPIDTSPS